MGLVELLMEKMTIPYEDGQKDKTERVSKRKGDFKVPRKHLRKYY